MINTSSCNLKFNILIQIKRTFAKELLDSTAKQIYLIKEKSEEKKTVSRKIFQQSSELKQVQELIIVMKGLSTMITSRRQQVKQYVLISSQREEKERELND